LVYLALTVFGPTFQTVLLAQQFFTLCNILQLLPCQAFHSSRHRRDQTQGLVDLFLTTPL